MRRVKATLYHTGRPVYIDLDDCPLITLGTINEAGPAGEIVKTHECTFIYTKIRTANGGNLVEYVKETPEELFALEPIFGPSIGAIDGAEARKTWPKPSLDSKTRVFSADWHMAAHREAEERAAAEQQKEVSKKPGGSPPGRKSRAKQ